MTALDVSPLDGDAIWAPHELRGPRLLLRPLARSDADALVAAASDGELWKLPFTVVPSVETVDAYLDEAMTGLADGTMLPWTVVVAATGEVVGTSRFCFIERAHRKLEIGYTWFARSRQRSFVNTEAKFLMLREAFDACGCVRVQLRTDALNAPSRTAIVRLGAIEEGIIRHDRIMPNGRRRDSACYSVIDGEWPAVRARLEERMRER